MAAVDSTKIYSDFAGLAQLRSDAAAGKSPGATAEAARQFEALFVQMMLQSMRDAGDVFGDDSDKTYRDMFDRQISLEMTRGKGLGLTSLLTRQLGANAGAGDTPVVTGLSPADRLSSPAIRAALQSLQAAGPASAPTVTPPTPEAAAPTLADTGVGTNATGAADATGTRQDWRPDSALQFMRDLLPHAIEAARQLGINPKAILAHAALETGWGQKVIRDSQGVSSNNLFNIKAGPQWSGEQLQVKTLEIENGLPEQKHSSFRAYPDLKSAFADYVNLLSGSSRYASAVRNGSQPEAFADSLQKAGYATDPGYAGKLRSILSSPRFEGLIGQLKKLVNVPIPF